MTPLSLQVFRPFGQAVPTSKASQWDGKFIEMKDTLQTVGA
jgi:hypothetical protein